MIGESANSRRVFRDFGPFPLIFGVGLARDPIRGRLCFPQPTGGHRMALTRNLDYLATVAAFVLLVAIVVGAL